MNPDPHRIANHLATVADVIHHHGADALRTARDWRSPLRASGGGPSSVGDHGDPTGDAACAPDTDLRRRYDQITNALNQLHDIACLAEHLILDTHIDPNEIERLRQQETDREAAQTRARFRYCWACGSPCERADGCDACRKLKSRTPPTTYLTHHTDQTPAAIDTAFVTWVQRRVAEGSLDRPGSPIHIERKRIHDQDDVA